MRKVKIYAGKTQSLSTGYIFLQLHVKHFDRQSQLTKLEK